MPLKFFCNVILKQTFKYNIKTKPYKNCSVQLQVFSQVEFTFVSSTNIKTDITSIPESLLDTPYLHVSSPPKVTTLLLLISNEFAWVFFSFI